MILATADILTAMEMELAVNRVRRRIVAVAVFLAPVIAGCGDVENTKAYQTGYEAGYEEGVAEICVTLQRQHAEIYDQVDSDIGCR